MDIVDKPILLTADEYLAYDGSVIVNVVGPRGPIEYTPTVRLLQRAATAMNAFKHQASKKLIVDMFKFFSDNGCVFSAGSTPSHPGGGRRSALVAIEALDEIGTSLPGAEELANRLDEEMARFDGDTVPPVFIQQLPPDRLGALAIARTMLIIVSQSRQQQRDETQGVNESDVYMGKGRVSA